MAYYDHTQGAASTSWVITHGLNASGIIVDVMIDNAGTIEKADPLSVTENSSNQVTIAFSVAQAGFARIIGGGLL